MYGDYILRTQSDTIEYANIEVQALANICEAPSGAVQLEQHTSCISHLESLKVKCAQRPRKHDLQERTRGTHYYSHKRQPDKGPKVLTLQKENPCNSENACED